MKIGNVFPEMPDRTGLAGKQFYALTVNVDAARQLGRQMDLPFVEEDPDCNVCMAGAETVLPAYRLTFNKRDLIEYIHACLGGDGLPDGMVERDWEFPVPESAEDFWRSIGK
mgnify:CR=1 FL=1